MSRISPEAAVEAKPEPSAIPTALELANLWVASYRFSQGLPGLQGDMLTYVCREILPEEALADPLTVQQSYDVALDRVNKIFESKNHAESSRSVLADFSENIITRTREMSELYTPPLSKIVESIFIRDATYLPANEHTVARSFGAARGRYFSYGVRYILLQRPTGCPEIDELFRRARPEIKSAAGKYYETKEYVDPGNRVMVFKNLFTFQAIVDGHIADNPEEKAEIEEALKTLVDA